ncbi:Glutamine--fructose-6-phosphate aminotransferase [isomerizing] [uncultured archaeon]|nr:Glutamine--fructose-6-phosphate aminotransferase [isomerizing] [uncultured archaeon]
MNHKCGICGVGGKENAEYLLYKMLLQMQHRGQLSAGITTYHPESTQRLLTYKELGLVNNAFHAEHKGKFASIMQSHKSLTGIGHVRYATSGADDKTYAQPFERAHGRKNKWFSFCFNGNISNYAELKRGLERENYHIVRETDTEIIMHLLSKSIKTSGSIVDVFSGASIKLDGSYNLAFMNAEGTIVAARDPLGFRPLSYTTSDGEMIFASESVALTSNGFDHFNDLAPGCVLIKENNDIRIERFASAKKKAHCFFEWVYFAHPASVMEGELVYKARHALGKELAKLETEKIDKDCIVVPVPDSSRPAGEGFAEALGIPCVEGLIRNRYVGRTFIESGDRAQKVKDKFTLVKQVIEGKKIFLVEDSIVRGTTLRNLIDFIKKNGNPKEIHVRVSCPPVRWPCFYGIDMSSRSELIAAKHEDNSAAERFVGSELGASSLIYQTEAGLIKAIGLDKKDMCLACLNGSYPTTMGEQLKLFTGNGRAAESKCK